MRIAFVFPGQGSQSVGMLSGFAGNETVAGVMARADEALGFSLWPESLPLACRMPTPKHPEKCADMRLALLCRGNAPQ